MSSIKEEKEINNNDLNDKNLIYKIEIATQTLDRNIGFITNCDNKTSIALASFGVLLVIILTNEGLNEIFNIIKSCIIANNLYCTLFLICFLGAIFLMGLGMFNLGSVLVAKTSEEAIGRKDENSRIFFAGIRKSGDYNIFYEKFYTMSKEELLSDLIEQIYINADIASIKYKTYNLGIKRTIKGFVSFVFLFLVGIFVF